MEKIQYYINEMRDLLGKLPVQEVETVIDILRNARISGNQIFTMGNGGSASTASHFVCDLSKNTQKKGFPPFRVIGLSDNMAAFSAYANDEGYDQVFSRQLQSLVNPGDIVIGISTSGNSPNVLNAIELARRNGATTIGFTGFDGGRLSSMVDVDVHIPSNIIEQVEDVHLMMEHLICKVLREEEQPQVLTGDLFYSIGREVAAELDLRNMLRHILQLTLDGLSADSGSIIVLNDKGDVSEVALAYAGEVQALDVQQFADIVERGLAGWVVAHRQAALVVDTKDDPRWLRRSWDNEGSSRSAISVPVLGDDRVTGVLTLVNSRAFQFKPEHLALLTAIAVSLSFIKVSTTR